MSRSRELQLESYTFYLDECLGGNKVRDALSSVGLRIEMHFDNFPRGTPDEEWLKVVGDRGWVLLTQDKRIRKRKNEIQALRDHKVRAFIVSVKELRGEEIGQLIVDALPKMASILRRNHAPIVAVITRSGAQLLEGAPRNPRKG